MKTLLVLPAVIGLAGCVAYGVPYGSADVYYGNPSAYGGGLYYGGSVPYGVSPPPVTVYGSGVYTHGPGYGRRDRDRDGIPDRWDRDRDGDGVPNRFDARPGNPRRY